MAVLVLPISNDKAHYEFITTLDGVEYVFTFRYNFRSADWYMSIADDTKQPILSGIPVRVNRDLLDQYRSYPVPQGLMLCINNVNPKVEATRDSFSKDVVILYYEV